MTGGYNPGFMARETPSILYLGQDSPKLRLTKDVLQTMGYSVLTASTTLDALSLFTSTAVEAVVLDTDLTRAEGGYLAHTMKRLKPEVPTVLLSDTEFAPAELAGAVDAVVVKLDGPEALAAEVRSLLEEARRQRELFADHDERFQELRMEKRGIVDACKQAHHRLREAFRQSRRLLARSRPLRKKPSGDGHL